MRNDWNLALDLAQSGRGRLTRGDAKGKFFVGHVIDHCNCPNNRGRRPQFWVCDCGRKWVTVNWPDRVSTEPRTWIPVNSIPWIMP